MVLVSCNQRRSNCIVCNKPNIFECKCIFNLHLAGNKLQHETLKNDSKNTGKNFALPKILTNTQSTRIGCIRYDDDSFSNKDSTYRFLQSRLEVKNAEYVIKVEVRENFRSNPSLDGSTSHQDLIYSGLVFINNIHPVVLPNCKDDLISYWRLGLVLKRCRQNDFDAHVSLSCVPSHEGKVDSVFFVKLQLQILNHFGQVHTRISTGQIQAVSEKIVAEYEFPHFISLEQLQDGQLNLLQNSQAIFKVLLVYATGYNSTFPCSETTFSSQKSDPAAGLESSSISPAIGIVTQTKFLTVNSNVIQASCPLLANEIRDNIILMETFSARSVRRMINFLRTKTLRGKNFTFTDLEELIQLGDQYNIFNFKNICFDMLIERLTVETAARAIVLSTVYDAPKNIILKIKEFVLRNGTAVRRNFKSTKFYTENFPLAFVQFMFGRLRCEQTHPNYIE